MTTPFISILPEAVYLCDDLALVAARRRAPRFSDEALERMTRSFEAFNRIHARGDAIYGVTTGFGPLVRAAASPESGEAQGMGLIRHLSAGFGGYIPAVVVRGAMFARLITLARGFSGVQPAVVEDYAEALARDIIAAVPDIGSLGASGDLIPLAHVAAALAGEGDALVVAGDGLTRTIPAVEALRKAGLKPSVFSARDALALVNGTSFSTAYLALAVIRAESLLERAEELTAWQMSVLRCRSESLEPRLHEAKGHAGQRCSAQRIAALLASRARDERVERADRPFQEQYSLRCAPQIIGAARDVAAFARQTVETELNGVDDNPLIDWERERALHGGNFMTQHLAFAADALNSALTQTGNLAERQIEAMMQPHTNGGAPLLLALASGSSGMAGAQLSATATLAEMRAHCQSYASMSLPTNAGNQDIVPMGFQAAREAYAQTERLAAIVATQALCLAQLAFALERSAENSSAENKPFSLNAPAWFPQDFQPIIRDRRTREELQRLQETLLRIADDADPDGE
jgi:histidine ammonia-lyase/tyrosine ammonia-lyase